MAEQPVDLKHVLQVIKAQALGQEDLAPPDKLLQLEHVRNGEHFRGSVGCDPIATAGVPTFFLLWSRRNAIALGPSYLQFFI